MINISRFPGLFETIFLSSGELHAARPTDLHFCELKAIFPTNEEFEKVQIFVDDEEVDPLSSPEIFEDVLTIVEIARQLGR